MRPKAAAHTGYGMPIGLPIRAAGLVLLLLGALLFGVRTFAQESTTDPPKPLTASAKTLSLLARARDAAARAESPEQKAAMMFQRLSFELRLKDKEPARSTLQELLQLASLLEKESTRTHLFEGVAVALADLGQPNESVKILGRITRVSARADAQLNLAEKILNDRETGETAAEEAKSFDVAALLRQSLDGAKEAKDAGLEALAGALLGRELARRGRQEEAQAVFRQARIKAREIEEIEERNIVGLIIRGQIQSGMLPAALATIESAPAEEQKETFRGLAALTLAQEGRMADAEKLLDVMKSGDVKDQVLIGIGRRIVKTATAAELARLAQSTSSADRKELFFQNILPLLLDEKRTEIFAELVGQSANAATFELNRKAVELDALIGEKKYDEAQTLIDSLDDEKIREAASRQIVVAQIQDGEKEAAAVRAKKTASEETKQEAAKLRDLMKTVAAVESDDDRISAYFELLQTQFGLLDLEGVEQTLAVLHENIERFQDPAKVVATRIILARIQSELGDKTAVQTNLAQLLQYLDGVKNIMLLKGLVPEEQPGPRPETDPDAAPGPRLALRPLVDESAVKDQLFGVYASIADAQAGVGLLDDARKTLEKAEVLAAEETQPVARFEKFYLLAQMTAEFDSAAAGKK